ncbi:hypothetical protein HSX11_19010 [Oxalobacteraceae bacterium]|nr:hypothetical protein [Oxalobacteraceae bacterium]
MRKLVLGAAAVATLLAAYFAPDQDGGVVGPAGATTREHAEAAPPAAALAEAAGSAGADAAGGSAATQPPAGAATVAVAADLQIHPRVPDDELGNVFAKQSWQPETPKKVMLDAAPQSQPSAKQAAASAPPLPFQFLGRFAEDGKAAYFLQIDGRNVVARAGEKIDDSYVLDSVSGDTLNFTYLPLNQKQTLVVGDTN